MYTRLATGGGGGVLDKASGDDDEDDVDDVADADAADADGGRGAVAPAVTTTLSGPTAAEASGSESAGDGVGCSGTWWCCCC